MQLERYLNTVRHMVGYFVNYIPADGIISWDFNANVRERADTGSCYLTKRHSVKHFRAYAEAAELTDNTLHARDYSHNPGGAWSVSPRQLTHITVIVAKC